MVTNSRILNLEPEGYSPKARAVLERLGQVDDGPMNRAELLDRICEYDVMIVRLGHRIDAQVMEAAQRLKTIVTATTGLNHIDMNEAQGRGITVLSLQGERAFLDNIHATAEHTWALLLALLRKLPQAHRHVLSGGWDRDRFKGSELHGRILGIIGLGRLGTKVAGYGAAFGMRVMGYESNRAHPMLANVEHMNLDQVLSQSDVISLHVNYFPENHAMISRKDLSRMKPGAVLINTSRGELVDESALLKALESGRLGGAALDVLCGEYAGWEASEGLLEYARKHDNLILTPHVGGCTFDSMEMTEVFMAEKLIRHLKRET
ncbi:NAD(P)-dependent oxidoreductase [Desulfonatronum lacustre]|uniref:NAD(P)-dependent oxidoreductase n=1 Tax=Desulfonatronum lacustre TaxID=66849 RepID=UPI00048FE377|nr:NAD(P)-dependent oxidoreductase [Desulfonatronum lacustre]